MSLSEQSDKATAGDGIDKLSHDFDIAICGAGPVGQALALMLVRQGHAAHRILLIDAKTADAAEQDARTIALSYGSQQLLSKLQATPDHVTSIEQIHVSRRGHFGRTLMDKKDYGLPALGYVARYGDIMRPLQKALAASGVVIRRPLKLTAAEENPDGVRLTLSDDSELSSALLIQAEGGTFGEQSSSQSSSNQSSIQHATKRDYQQTALIAHITCSAPILHRAFERFTDEGPLALLPQQDGYALVWCVSAESAQRLSVADDATFLSALQMNFGERVGTMLSVTSRTAYPLGLNVQARATARTIHVGNAAQTLHPVAGQGLNLGLRDAAVLATALGKNFLQIPSLTALSKARDVDRQLTIGLTDLMATIFTSQDQRLPQPLLSLGLGLLDVFPFAKGVLARQMLYGWR